MELLLSPEKQHGPDFAQGSRDGPGLPLDLYHTAPQTAHPFTLLQPLPAPLNHAKKKRHEVVSFFLFPMQNYNTREETDPCQDASSCFYLLQTEQVFQGQTEAEKSCFPASGPSGVPYRDGDGLSHPNSWVRCQSNMGQQNGCLYALFIIV